MGKSQASDVKLTLKILSKLHRIKISKSHLPTLRSFTAHASVFAVFISAIGYSYHSPGGGTIASVLMPDVSATEDESSVKQVTALQVAGGIAERANLPIAANIANLSISLDAERKISKNDTAMISKPQIIEPMTGKRSVETYTVKDGDSIQSIADQFQVTTQTIKWANDLSSDIMEVGSAITVLPIDGVVYDIKDGDTIDSIAERYKSDSAQIIAFNDLELSGLKNDQQIILPNAELPIDEQPGYVAPVAETIVNAPVSSPASGGSPLINGYSPIPMAAAGNAYAFGNCTSWAYERRVQLGHPVGSYWGNGATWDSSARAAGYIVDKNPTVGAVFQMPAFVDAYTGVYGHVGIVESVNPDGSIYISEMNYAGNFNLVTYRTIPAVQVALYNYIH